MEDKLQEFFSNILDICLQRADFFPKRVSIPLERWAASLREALLSSRFIRAVSDALTRLKADSPELHNVLEHELDAVVVIQREALPSPEKAQQVADQGRGRNSKATKTKRAAQASKSLLSSYREILANIIPGWASGLFKVAEELIDIYGPDTR